MIVRGIGTLRQPILLTIRRTGAARRRRRPTPRWRTTTAARVAASSHQSRASIGCGRAIVRCTPVAPKPRASIAVARRTPRRTAATSTASTCAANARTVRHRRPAGVEAAGPPGPADLLPVRRQQRQQPQRGQRAVGEPGRQRATAAPARRPGPSGRWSRAPGSPGSAIASSRSDTATADSTPSEVMSNGPSRHSISPPSTTNRLATATPAAPTSNGQVRRASAASRHPRGRHQRPARAASSSAGVTGSRVSSSPTMHDAGRARSWPPG